ncbi:MAG TPA: acetamidase/formamidase family protein [Candidatus Acidoferrum sp.]|nr:acetamidase/formamidase family protein [Candidatus Acidoferrum sp.]
MFEKTVYSFDAKNEPIGTVKPGEVLTFKTLDCFDNQIRRADQLVTKVDFSHVNPATGPVYIEGAKPGDVLKVVIRDIEVSDQGVTTSRPGTGPLSYWVTQPTTSVIPIKGGMAHFKDITFPTRPMVGVIGVAPEGDKVVPTGWADAHGGNMDCKLITKGAVLYFPVWHEGALLQMGDIHATMGDGEVCGTGIEVDGVITLTTEVIKNFPLDMPVLETPDKWYAIAVDKVFDEALKKSCRQLQQLVSAAYGWTLDEVFHYFSIQGDFEICQACVPHSTSNIIRFGIPKRADKPLIK